MATLAQYNHDSTTADYEQFLTISASSDENSSNYYEPTRRLTASDVGTTVDESLQFRDECLKGDFAKGVSYFAHLRFLRQPEEDAGIQKFSVKLVNYDSSDSTEQHIKDIVVSQADYMRYIPVANNDIIDLIENRDKYYLKTVDSDGTISYDKIDADDWYTIETNEDGEVIKYTAVPKTDGKFVYADNGQHSVNYYQKIVSEIDLSDYKWSENKNPSDIGYSGIKNKSELDIKDNKIITSTFKLLNSYADNEENPICLLEENPLWGDVEFTFTPLTDFTCLLFTLQRTAADYQGNTRYPLILYQEISEINTILGKTGYPPTNLLKIGVLSHPYLKMFINKEEIHIGGTGMYEIHSGKLLINSFSILSEVQDTDIEDKEFEIYTNWKEDKYEDSNTTPSYSLIPRKIDGTTRTREIDSFTIDYMV